MLHAQHDLTAGPAKVDIPLLVPVMNCHDNGRLSEIPSGEIVCAHTFS